MLSTYQSPRDQWLLLEESKLMKYQMSGVFFISWPSQVDTGDLLANQNAMILVSEQLG